MFDMQNRNNGENGAPEGQGWLQVRVTSARGAFPIEGAVVMVLTDPNAGSGEQSSVIRTLRTDRSGLTETVPLPAPPRYLSQTPGSAKPYATYNISVSKEGYYDVEGLGIPVFDGVVSTQAVNLLPEDRRAPGSMGGETSIREEPGYLNLRSGSAEDGGTAEYGAPEAETDGGGDMSDDYMMGEEMSDDDMTDEDMSEGYMTDDSMNAEHTGGAYGGAGAEDTGDE